MQRLWDKAHSWGEEGVLSLIPDVLLQGITGNQYSRPDMIGGGEYLNFQQMEGRLDEELFIRHSKIACLMPCMQFSAAPFRVLSGDSFKWILKSIDVRKKYIEYIMELIEHTFKTGEPIIRYMSYEFSHEPVEKIINQFMLGSKYLVSPIYEKGKHSRFVYIPKGEWRHNEDIIKSNGETIEIKGNLGEPIVLERL